MRDAAQILLNSYVRLQGLHISQMLRKSVETRDWLNCLEPRSVRAVMKRVVEELSAIEMNLGDLYDQGTRTSASSDSSRKTHLRCCVCSGVTLVTLLTIRFLQQFDLFQTTISFELVQLHSFTVGK